MRVVLQRVKQASVSVDGQEISKIGHGFLILLGISNTDTEINIPLLVDKIKNLRVFEDENGKMNLSLIDVKGEVLIISQFTLYANCKGQRRPSFIEAAPSALAEELYKKFIQRFKETGLRTAEGEFGAMMDISLMNSGPVTITLDTKDLVG